MPSHRPHSAIAVVAASLILMLAMPASAEPAEPAEAAAAKRVDPDKRVCRSVKVTGSQIRQRVCYKQKQWDRMREESQQTLRNANRRVTAPQPQ